MLRGRSSASDAAQLPEATAVVVAQPVQAEPVRAEAVPVPAHAAPAAPVASAPVADVENVEKDKKSGAAAGAAGGLSTGFQ